MPPTRSHNSILDGSFLLSASHRSILVCLFTPNGSHTLIVGRFIPAILLKCDDFSTFLKAIRTSCKTYCRPLEAIIPILDGSFLLSASHRSILACLFTPNGRHTLIVGPFILAILLKCDDFSTFLPAIRTSCKAYCRPLEAIIRYWMVHSALCQP